MVRIRPPPPQNTQHHSMLGILYLRTDSKGGSWQVSGGHLQPPWLRRSEANPSFPTRNRRSSTEDWRFLLLHYYLFTLHKTYRRFLKGILLLRFCMATNAPSRETREGELSINGMLLHLPGYGWFRTRSSSAISSLMTTGLAMWPFIPAAKAFCLSSSKALAVIARMGMPATAGLGSFRIRRVAS